MCVCVCLLCHIHTDSHTILQIERVKTSASTLFICGDEKFPNFHGKMGNFRSLLSCATQIFTLTEIIRSPDVIAYSRTIPPAPLRAARMGGGSDGGAGQEQQEQQATVLVSLLSILSPPFHLMSWLYCVIITSLRPIFPTVLSVYVNTCL